MAELAGAVPVALEQLAVEDDPGAHAAAHADDDQVGGPGPAEERELGERGRMAVVGDHDRDAEPLLEQRSEAQLGPVQVHGPADGPRAGVDDTGCADADAEPRGLLTGTEGVHELHDELDGGVAVGTLEREVDRAEDLAMQIDDRAPELRLAEVETDHVATVGGDAQQDRRLAPARPAAADLLDQAVADQRADKVADGGASQAGEPGEVGARERAVVVQGAQDQLLVERPRLLVRRLLRQDRRAGTHSSGLASDRDHPDQSRAGTGTGRIAVGSCASGPTLVKSVDKREAGCEPAFARLDPMRRIAKVTRTS